MNGISARQHAGLVLGIIVGLVNIPAAFIPGGNNDAGDPTGPPVFVLVVGAVVGVLIALFLLQWRRTDGRGWLRTSAVLMILLALLALPGVFTPSVEGWVRVAAGVYVLGTLASLVMLFSPGGRTEQLA